jgi:hypothetical protein
VLQFPLSCLLIVEQVGRSAALRSSRSSAHGKSVDPALHSRLGHRHCKVFGSPPPLLIATPHALPCCSGAASQYLRRYGSMANGVSLGGKIGLERRPSKQPVKKKPRKR